VVPSGLRQSNLSENSPAIEFEVSSKASHPRMTLASCAVVKFATLVLPTNVKTSPIWIKPHLAAGPPGTNALTCVANRVQPELDLN
jgi:hypothetical protein